MQSADAYRCATAPVALLRAYAKEGRWFGLRDGFIDFEDDSIRYPTSTPTLMRESPRDDAPRLTLSSLWFLVSLRDRYEKCATAQLLVAHDATRIAEKHTTALLDYLLGRREWCE